MNTTSSSDYSSTGLDANVAATLSYCLIFVSGIVMLLIERRSRFVRFHALQSTITFLGLWIAQGLLGLLPLIGWLVGVLILPLAVVLWVVLMVKAYQGVWYRLPIAGDIAARHTR